MKSTQPISVVAGHVLFSDYYRGLRGIASELGRDGRTGSG
jgi:hypothetical protein